ncbi:unnamed protein product [Durusdinium trenchii]|uniref:Uncharacterized protein n=1 Tax=Durusdinium trenchii TaxID=1381693 RepID=A0ABP0I1T6_9DINO
MAEHQETAPTRDGHTPSVSAMDGELHHLEGETDTGTSAGTFHRSDNGLRPSARAFSELEILLSIFWVPASIFVVAEVGAYASFRKSFFVALTGNAFDLGLSYARVVELHVWASIAMWTLAAFQIHQRTRKWQSPWLHRLMGKAMLLTFFIVVFPTSLYLSALQRIDYLAPAVAAVLLDTASCTAFFLYRAWRVARTAVPHRNPKSMALHGRLMQCGTMMSMSILPQRFLQFYLTMHLKMSHQANYSISILVTSLLFFVYGHFFDGPRGRIWVQCIGAEHLEEALGRRQTGSVERWLWRLRWVIYVGAYYLLRRSLPSETMAGAG